MVDEYIRKTDAKGALSCSEIPNSSDSISRQDAIDALKICDNNEDGLNCHKCPIRDRRWNGAWEDDGTACYRKLMRDSAKLLESTAADVVPVRLGEWLDGYKTQTCSLCKCRGKKSWTFCPHCGARMIYGKREE